jgi:hypothetical protein
MSQHFSNGMICDPEHPLTLDDFVTGVGLPGNSRSMAIVEVSRILPARWNTEDGERPTQAEANVMAVDPSIFTPLELSVTREIAGEALPRTLVAFAPAGVIGDERRQSGCDFTASPDGTVHSLSGTIVAGHRYLALFGQELLTGRKVGPIERAELDDLFEIVDGRVVGPGGSREPIPTG